MALLNLMCIQAVALLPSNPAPVNWGPWFILMITVLYVLTMVAVVASFMGASKLGEKRPLTSGPVPPVAEKQPSIWEPHQVERSSSWARTDGGAGVQKSSALERREFVRRVYSILVTQLFGTVALAVLFIQAAFDQGDPRRPTELGRGLLAASWILWVLLIPILVVLCALMCCKNKYPFNFILLAVFTTLEAVLIGFICVTYFAAGAGAQILIAFGLATVVFLALTLFTMISGIDFDFCGPFLFASLIVLLVWGIVMSILVSSGVYSWGWHLAYSLIGALLFCGFIVFDTHMILNRLGTDDYIIAAVELYLDFINLFLYLLQILTLTSRS